MKTIYRLLTIAATTTLLATITLTNNACIDNSCSEFKWGYPDGVFNRYSVNANLTTPNGTSYDPSGLPISPLLIDRLTIEVEQCLEKQFPNKVLPDNVRNDAMCANTNVDVPIDRTSFVVKVASDYIITCDGTNQVLPVLSGSAGCIAKGQTPTEECPCRYRAGIQCPNHLITTPSFYIYKDVLVRFLTGCKDPWASQELFPCITPSTTPLSDGSDPTNGLP